MRKIRSDSLLDQLPADQQTQLCEWLLTENLSLAEARDRLRERFAVQIGLDPIARFARRQRRDRQFENIREQLEDYQSELQESPSVPPNLLAKLMEYRTLEFMTADSSDQNEMTKRMRILCQSQLAAARQEHARAALERVNLEKAEFERSVQEALEAKKRRAESDALYAQYRKAEEEARKARLQR